MVDIQSGKKVVLAEIDLCLVWWSADLFDCCVDGRNWFGLWMRVENRLVLVWASKFLGFVLVVEIDLISAWEVNPW